MAHPLFGIHANALSLQSQRLEMIAGNLANADTPGYRARDIDFKAALEAAAAGQQRPAETVYRDLDAKGEDALAIRRVLDQAALKSGTEGGVIATGRLRADTISALLLWGLQDRARRVALVPVSAVLTRAEVE